MQRFAPVVASPQDTGVGTLGFTEPHICQSQPGRVTIQSKSQLRLALRIPLHVGTIHIQGVGVDTFLWGASAVSVVDGPSNISMAQNKGFSRCTKMLEFFNFE